MDKNNDLIIYPTQITQQRRPSEELQAIADAQIKSAFAHILNTGDYRDAVMKATTNINKHGDGGIFIGVSGVQIGGRGGSIEEHTYVIELHK